MSTLNPMTRSGNRYSLSEADAWLVLQTLPGMTPERLNRLTESFAHPADALEAPPDVFARLCGRKAREALEKDSPTDLAARIRQEASKLSTTVITRDSARYPEPLREIFAPPGAFSPKGKSLKRIALPSPSSACDARRTMEGGLRDSLRPTSPERASPS